MTKYYNEVKKSAVTTMGCIIGDFYAILEEDYWHRVQCIDIDSDTGIATVFFIDEGYEEQYKPDALCPLDKKFCTLPAQVSRVSDQNLFGSIIFYVNHILITYASLYYIGDQSSSSRIGGLLRLSSSRWRD